MYHDFGHLMQASCLESRCASFENPTGARGSGGSAASRLGPGRKGSPNRRLEPSETVVLLDTEGPGMIRHIWLTCLMAPELLRGVLIRAFWDGATEPAVCCPLGDFFGVAHGRTNHFFNAFQAMQEGTGLNAYFPMPFSRHARIEIFNDRAEALEGLYYYIDYTLGDDSREFRFHCAFSRSNPTVMGQDFDILPLRNGRGSYLGCVVGIRPLSPQWWGEGELKIYLDDDQLPSICGTGTEDYLGSAWGVGQHFAPYGGAPYVANQAGDRQKLVSFYRWHALDPIFWHRNIRVSLQQIGGGWIPEGRIDYYERCDDVSAAAFWYQDPGEPLWPQPDSASRQANLERHPCETPYQRIGL
jgi:hypothetical protein